MEVSFSSFLFQYVSLYGAFRREGLAGWLVGVDVDVEAENRVGNI